MRAPPWLRALTPLGWGLLVAALLVAVVVGGRGLGLRWDPFGMAERRLDAAEARAQAAALDAAARRLEIEGAAEQARRLDHLHQQAVAVERMTAETVVQARSAHDASTPLDPARADRLLRHDRELCRLAAALSAAATPDPARSGGSPVPTGAPA